MSQNFTPRISIPLDELEDVACPRCNNLLFDIKHKVKKVPALYSPHGREDLVLIVVLVCSNCGYVLDSIQSLQPQTSLTSS